MNTRKQIAREFMSLEAVPGAHRTLCATIARALLLLIPLLLATPSKASAYVDPGSGAFVYQAAYAAFLGGSFYLRKLLDRFWPKRKKDGGSRFQGSS
jgi:hypothetical protein